jgi:tetratricopeptide (TPR) repeat protein
VLFALGRYQEAVQSYQNAVSSFPQSAAVIDAYLQIADCYRRMGKQAEMRGTIQQAKLMLQRLPADADFGDVSNFSRDQWSRMLDALGS